MSYSINLFFNTKPCFTKEEAFEKALLFTEKLIQPENALKLIEDNLLYFPSEKENLNMETKKPTIGDRYFLDLLFSPQFIYWTKHHMFAVIGDYAFLKSEYINALFQDSCDQDYEYEEWNGLPFTSLIKAIKNGEMDDQVIEKYSEIYGKREVMDDISYFRKFFLYKYIEEKLSIQNILMDNDSTEFIRFSVNALNSPKKHMDMEILMRTAINSKKEKDKAYWQSILDSPDKLEMWYKRMSKCCDRPYSIEQCREDIRKLAEEN